jgi:acetyl esterase/lipase
VNLRLVLPLLLLSSCALKSVLKTVSLPEGGREVRDVVYWHGEDFDEQKHKLDIYAPPGPGPFPVLVFVHGGGWRLGDRQQFMASYIKLGRRMAGRGVIAVVTSYRLSPEHKHPAQIRDVSRALGWTLKHIGEYGGDPSRVYAMGHSAGAQLVALAACDKRWLEEVGASPQQLAGVIGVSGPYDVAHLGRSLFTGGLPMVIPAFGSDEAVWSDVSPATHLREHLPPPFFIGWADGDFEVIRGDAKHFIEALTDVGAEVDTFQGTFDDHFSVITNFADDSDRLAERVLRFMKVTR